MTKLMSIPGAGPARAPFHYTMSGLEDVWLQNGFAVEHTCYGEDVRIEDADGLHRALARSIVSDKMLMNERELLFLRKLMVLSRDDLARLLGCSDQRIACWEEGESTIDPFAERLYRMLVREWLGDA
jgi:putative transcriptional regulator